MEGIPDIIRHINTQLPDFRLQGPPIKLSGGYLNLTWRIKAYPHNIIAKWVAPYIVTQPDFYLPPERAALEAKALQWLGQHQWEGLRMPILLDFDPKQNIILMEDMGRGRNFSQWMIDSTGDKAHFEEWGNKLGAFIGRLHTCSWGDASLQQGFNNHKIQEVRLKVEYDFDFSRLDPPTEVLVHHQQVLADKVMSPGLCLTMGDFWPLSVLLCKNDIPAIIDWEFVHFGFPFQDFAHMWAHIWMHAHISPPERKEKLLALLHAYVKAYATYMEAYLEEEANIIAYHIGTEVLQRSLGNFVQGYIYENQDPNTLQEAASFGRKCLENGTCQLLP